MSTVDTRPTDTDPADTGTDQVPPLPENPPSKDPTPDRGGDVPMDPNPYMGGGGTPA